jgi:hypothetical protein
MRISLCLALVASVLLSSYSQAANYVYRNGRSVEVSTDEAKPAPLVATVNPAAIPAAAPPVCAGPECNAASAVGCSTCGSAAVATTAGAMEVSSGRVWLFARLKANRQGRQTAKSSGGCSCGCR